MNMNSIINMFMKLIMRKAMNKGINAGIKGASGMARKRPAKSRQMAEMDEYDAPANQAEVQDTSERDRIRAARRARKAGR